MTHYLTHAAAAHEADRLPLADLPTTLGVVVWRTVANPEAGPDTLLILADALRIQAAPQFTPLADAIATLAPTRATALPEART